MRSAPKKAKSEKNKWQCRAKIHRGVDLISNVLPYGRVWYGEPDAISNAINFAKFNSRSHHAAIRVYDETAM
jgi:hypothetical protein